MRNYVSGGGHTLLPALLTAIGLAACSDWNDVGTETVPDGITREATAEEAIAFEACVVPSVSAPTRADGSLINRLETSLFETKERSYWGYDDTGELTEKKNIYSVGIYGVYTGNKTWHETWNSTTGKYTGTANFMYNQPMTVAPPDAAGINALNYYSDKTMKDSKTGTYLPTDSLIRFWPNSETEGGAHDMISFWAYYPYNPTTAGGPGEHGIHISTGENGVDTGNGMGKVQFTMNSDASEHSDFMISELVADCSRDTHPLVSDNKGGYQPKPVRFRFHHMLAQVRLYAYITGTDKLVYPTYTPAGESDPVPISVTAIDGTNIKLSNGDTKTVDIEKQTYLDARGNLQTVKVGDFIPDDTPWLEVANPATERWLRDETEDVNGTKHAKGSLSMSFNNIYTSCTFTPDITYDDVSGTYTTKSTYTSATTLGSVTVNHYIMNPYWFRFLNGERVMLNENYMYDYFEGTPAYKGVKSDDNYDGFDWSSKGSNSLKYVLNNENKDPDYTKGSTLPRYEGVNNEDELHYNYPTGNIILAVPQVFDDDNVPNITIDAVGTKVEYEQNAEGKYSVKEETKTAATARVTINMLQMGIKWESGFIYCYAFVDDLRPGDDKVRGPETITVVFDPSRHTDQW